MYGGTLQFRAGEKISSYLLSRLVQKTEKHRFWSIFDLDGTYAAGSFEARRKVREWAEKRGALLFSTARTPELVMTPESYELSRQLAGFARPMPWWVYGTGPLQHDPDAILAFGEGIFIAGIGCSDHGFAPYFVDKEYEDRYLDPATDGVLANPKSWKELLLDVVHELGFDEHLAVIDRAHAHTNLEANVLGAKYRLAIEVRGDNAIERKHDIVAKIREHIKGTPLALRVEGVDESNPSVDPKINRGTEYLMPPEARKENMMNHALVQTTRHARENGRRLEPSMVKGVIAGDQFTDLVAICEGGLDANFAGVLVGGSPLTKAIAEKESSFSGIDLRQLHSCLMPTGRAGYYYYDNAHIRGATLDPRALGYKDRPRQRRTVVIGGIAYPGTVGADTIWAYIEDNKEQLALAV